MPAGALVSVLATLVVQVHPEVLAPHQDVLLASCSKALGDDKCELLGEGSAGHAPAEIVQLSADHFEVVLEVEDNTEGAPSGPKATRTAVRREVTFQPSDLPQEMARSLGLTLGILAREARLQASQSQTPENEGGGSDEDPQVTEDKEDRANSKDTPVSVEGDEERSLSWLLALQAGAVWEPSLKEVGVAGDLSAAGFPWRHFGFSGRFAGSYAKNNAGTAPDWGTVGATAGVAYRSDLGGPWLLLRLESGVEQLRSRLRSEFTSGASALGTRAVAVALVSAQTAFPLSQRLFLHVGPELRMNFSRTEVFVDDALVGTTSVLRVAVLVGLTWSAP